MTRTLRTASSVLALAAAVQAAGCGAGAAKAPGAPAPAPVVVGLAERRSVPVALRAIGNVEAMAGVALRSQVAGQVLEVHIKDGADVPRGALLFTIDPHPFRIALDRAQAELARDKALLEKADNDVARYRKLVDKEYVTREQYEGATSQAASLTATIRSDQAAVADAELNLSYCAIRAPIAGRAGSVAVKAGNLVKANEDPPLVTILQTHPIYVTFSIAEKYLSDLRRYSLAHRLEVSTRQHGESGAGHLGSLAFIDNAVDATTGTIRLKAEFGNDDRGLWPGQFVEVELRLAEQADAVVVPSTAIQVGQQGSYVFVVGADGTAEQRAVVVDRTAGELTVIASGLAGGETVITDGQIRVVPGAKVAVEPKESRGAAPKS